MKRSFIFIAFLLFSKICNGQTKRYLSLKPLLGGKIVFNSPQSYLEVAILGLNVGQGWSIKNHKVGFDLSYDRTYYKYYTGRSDVIFRAEYQYYFYSYKKVSTFIGIMPELTYFSYTPEVNGFRYYNDPIDNAPKSHFIPVFNINTGVDFTLKKKYHVLLAISYEKQLNLKSGSSPYDTPISFRLDFRAPFPKLLMKKNSSIQNYY